MKPKVKRVQGVSLMKLLTSGEIDYAITFASEVDDPGVEVVGTLPRDISTPTALVGFISSHAKSPLAAKGASELPVVIRRRGRLSQVRHDAGPITVLQHGDRSCNGATLIAVTLCLLRHVNDLFCQNLASALDSRP